VVVRNGEAEACGMREFREMSTQRKHLVLETLYRNKKKNLYLKRLGA
jgi:hypothetical protein